MANLFFSGTLAQCDPKNTCVLIVGQPANLALITYKDVKMKLEPRVDEKTFSMLVGTLHPNPTDTCSLWLNNATLAALPAKRSRHNTFSASHMLSKIVKTNLSGGEEHVVIVCQRRDVFALACAVARVLPLYNMKSAKSGKRNVRVEFLLVGADAENPLTEQDITCLTAAAEAIRLSASIVDKPCSDMNTDTFIDEIKRVGVELNIKPVIIRGKDLQEQGFGGLWHVGKAATAPPALVVLSHRVEGATKNIAWVGKGIVYDTGGLCIKSKSSMCSMKRDCGGAAGILGAFYTTVRMGFKENLHAVFCLAENAVGPNALRPDDIITLYSGRTVEINNTDAEGRLVLGDGVAYAVKDLKATTVVDMATLTGAQGIATGRYHASIVCNDSTMERLCVVAGQYSGDLVHPMPYTPELHFSEFSSALADMKNSVADRSNAQVSCAGLFIHAHLGFDFPGVWLHIDMASPVAVGERATGYGVALLCTLFGQDSESSLLQSIAPSEVCNGLDAEEGNAPKKMRLV